MSRSHHDAPTVGWPANGNSVAGVKIRACAVAAPLFRHIDEYRFAVTQFSGDALSVARAHRACVDHAERIAELPVRIRENAQHRYVDSHAPDATTCR